MRDKYEDFIEDGDLVLIQIKKHDGCGQELYEYSSYSQSFIPCRESVMIGTYELKLEEIEWDDVSSDRIRRLYN